MATNQGALEMVHSDAHVFSINETRERVQAIHRIMKDVMRKDVHYGKIPGTPKPTLYKPGSEVLLLTFRIGIEPEIADLSTPDEIRYRIRALGRHVPTGSVVGIGVGECSSKEEKFLWREAVCKDEYDAAPEDHRRIKYKKRWENGRQQISKIEQIKVPPADAANAVLKRAKKRAQVDFCLTAMAASDIFTQDVEDLPDGYLNDEATVAPVGETVNQSELAEVQELFGKLSEVRQKALLKLFKAERLKDVPATEFVKFTDQLRRAFKLILVGQEATLTALIDEIGGTCKAEFLATNRIKKLSELPASQYQGAVLALEKLRSGAK